jgi:hypothetical protein
VHGEKGGDVGRKMDERTRERAYTFHKAKESAYARAGLYAKARSHADRAFAYAAYSRASSFGGGEKTHRIFVLAPLNDEAERKLSEMVAESEAYARIEVYIQGFSEPQMHAGVCGTDESKWKDKGCTNVLPAQFNQYCSDDPLALVHLIKRHGANEKVKFVIMPTQLTKNAAFSEAVVAEHKKLLPAKWRELDLDTKRKIASWHGIALDPADAVRDRLERLEKMKLKPLFDPFVAYMIHKKDATSLSRLDVEVGVSALGMPTMRARGPTGPGGPQSPGGSGASNVELVFHATEAEAARDGAEYARYVWDAMTHAVGWRHDGNFVNSPIVDIYSADPARYERNKGAYLGTMSEHERFSGLRAMDFAEIGRVIEAKYYFDD